MDVLALLKKHFGFLAFRPGQRPVVEAALSGRDVLAIMPTGAGKSLTYQLPAVAAPGLTLVISPLIALMKDQVDTLQSRGVAAAALNSSLSEPERARVLARLPRTSLLYLAPERLGHPTLQRALERVFVSRLVVDEAHCISEWGHDFRPDYRNLKSLRRRLGNPPVTALTATATPRVQEDIIATLGLESPVVVNTGFDRPNLGYRVWPVAGESAKGGKVKAFLEGHKGAGLIYVGTRQEAEALSERVSSWGYRCSCYHGGRSPEARQAVQDALMAGRLQLVVATNAFGMGIDKPDLRFVLHYRLPSTLESYYQEAGRAGRDGGPAVCTLLYTPEDRELQAYFIESSSPSTLDLKRLYLALRNADGTVSIRGLARDLGMSAGKVQRGLDELVEGAILAPFEREEGSLQAALLSPYDREVPNFDASRLQSRKEHRYRLLDKVLAYAESPRCRRATLLEYFGETPHPERCSCDRCTPAPIPLSDDDRAALRLLEHRPLPLDKAATALKEVLAEWKPEELSALLAGLLKGGLLETVRGKLHPSEQGLGALNPEARLLELVRQGAKLPEIAAASSLSAARTERLLLNLMLEGKLALERLVRPEVKKAIEVAVAEHGASRFKQLRDALPKSVSDFEVRAVLAYGESSCSSS